MSNTYNTCLTIAAAVVMISFAAHAQTVSAESPALQVEIAPPPLSITQRYVPVSAPVRNTNAPLQLLIVDDSQASQPLSPPAPLAVSDEVGVQPAINALGPGRFAISVSQASGHGR